MNVSRHKRRADAGPKESILVGLGLSGVARMEFRRSLFHLDYANRNRQSVIKRVQQVFSRYRTLKRKARDLCERVDSSIRSSRALGQDALAGHMLDRVGQSGLNGWPLGLNLPSAKVSSVVGERDFEVPGDPFGSSLITAGIAGTRDRQKAFSAKELPNLQV